MILRFLFSTMVLLAFSPAFAAEKSDQTPTSTEKSALPVQNGTRYDYPYLSPPSTQPYPTRLLRPREAMINKNWNAWLSNPYRPLIVRGQEEAIWLGLQRGMFDFSPPEERKAKAEAKAKEEKLAAEQAAKAAARAAPPPKEEPEGINPFGWIGGIGRIGNPNTK